MPRKPSSDSTQNGNRIVTLRVGKPILSLNGDDFEPVLARFPTSTLACAPTPTNQKGSTLLFFIVPRSDYDAVLAAEEKAAAAAEREQIRLEGEKKMAEAQLKAEQLEAERRAQLAFIASTKQAASVTGASAAE